MRKSMQDLLCYGDPMMLLGCLRKISKASRLALATHKPLAVSANWQLLQLFRIEYKHGPLLHFVDML